MPVSKGAAYAIGDVTAMVAARTAPKPVCIQRAVRNTCQSGAVSTVRLEAVDVVFMLRGVERTCGVPRKMEMKLTATVSPVWLSVNCIHCLLYKKIVVLLICHVSTQVHLFHGQLGHRPFCWLLSSYEQIWDMHASTVN